MNKNDPAMPLTVPTAKCYSGLTKREYTAIMLLQGLVASPTAYDSIDEAIADTIKVTDRLLLKLGEEND